MAGSKYAGLTLNKTNIGTEISTNLPSRKDQVQAILESTASLCEKRINLIQLIRQENGCRNGLQTNHAFDIIFAEINAFFTNLEGRNCLGPNTPRRQLFPRGALTHGDPDNLALPHTLSGQYASLQRLITSDKGIKKFGCPDYLTEALHELARQTYLKCLAEIVVEASNILSKPHIHAKVSYLTYLEIDRLYACIDAANEEIKFCGDALDNLTRSVDDSLRTREESYKRWIRITQNPRNKDKLLKSHKTQWRDRNKLHVMLGLEEPPKKIDEDYFLKLANEMAMPVRSNGGPVGNTATLDVR